MLNLIIIVAGYLYNCSVKIIIESVDRITGVIGSAQN